MNNELVDFEINENIMNLEKRPRVDLTIQQKYEIIKYREANPQLKQNEIRFFFNKKFNREVPKSTFSDILANRAKILAAVEDSAYTESELSKKRIREAKFPQLERSLYRWVCEKQAASGFMPVTDEMIVEKAKELSGSMGIGIMNFAYSNGWLIKFKRRHDLTSRRYSQSSYSLSSYTSQPNNTVVSIGTNDEDDQATDSNKTTTTTTDNEPDREGSESNENREDSSSSRVNEEKRTVSHDEACNALQTLFNYFEQFPDTYLAHNKLKFVQKHLKTLKNSD